MRRPVVMRSVFAVSMLCFLGLMTPAVLAAPKVVECTAPRDVLRLKVKLPNTARAIRRGKQLVIVAIGSSSTEGHGASSESATYPARLSRELALRWPKLPIKVFNEGVAGETAREMLARFQTDVMVHKPHLVIWQVGSNAILNQRNLDEYVETLRRGVARLRAAKSDIILMDPQFAPLVVAQPMHRSLIAAMGAIANDLKVGLFQRFAVMRYWVSKGDTKIEDVISRDRLHMNDASYACIAQLLADSVTVAAREGIGLSPADAERKPLVAATP